MSILEKFTVIDLIKTRSASVATITAFCGAQRQLVRWPTAAERR